LNLPVEENPVKAAIAESDAVLAMLVKGVHRQLPVIRSWQDSRSKSHLPRAKGVRDIKGKALG
jgi:hypothetical protein